MCVFVLGEGGIRPLLKDIARYNMKYLQILVFRKKDYRLNFIHGEKWGGSLIDVEPITGPQFYIIINTACGVLYMIQVALRGLVV